VKLTGTIPDNREQFRLRGALPDPADVFCDILADSLAARGYDIATTCAFYDNPSDYYSWQPWQVKPFYEHCSPPLSEIVQRINVSSNNHFAEHLVRALSYSGYGKQIVANRYGYNNKTFDALQTGIDAAKNVLGDCQIDLSSLVMYDGCGLSRSNRVTAQLLCKLLHYMRTKSAHREAFLASLPAAGVDGTVSSVLKNTSLHGKIIMKSGTMNGIKCYAGYYSAPDREYSFAVLVNHFKCSTEQTIKEIETLLLGVFTTQPDKQTKNAESRQP